MKEFIYGTLQQFQALCRSLPEEGSYLFRDRVLPDSCSKTTASIWFAKSENGYRVYIDGGISTTAKLPAFRRFLERGEAGFSSVEEMEAFFRSLRPLVKQENNTVPSGTVVNKEKLRKIREERERKKTVRPEQLAAPLKEKVYGQDEAIDELCKKVAVRQLQRDRRLLTVALLGPTATGKSETAKSLAKVMSDAYGTPYGYLEIAGSELIGEHTVHRFFGAPPGYVGHGSPTLLEPVRKNPRQVIVINEIEKADGKILVGLMEAIDTGMVGMADNSPAIDLNECVLLLTSNLPIDIKAYNAASGFARAEMCRDAFTKHCGRPEISGKIGNFIAFQPLSEDAIVDIAIKFIQEELDNYRLKLLKVDAELVADILRYQTQYGARAIRELVREAVGQRLLQEEDLDGQQGGFVILEGTLDHLHLNFEEVERVFLEYDKKLQERELFYEGSGEETDVESGKNGEDLP